MGKTVNLPLVEPLLQICFRVFFCFVRAELRTTPGICFHRRITLATPQVLSSIQAENQECREV